MAADVAIVGAGPVGLTLANILGLHGVRTIVVEQRDKLIDYPRGVGIDDESLRAFQAIGLIDQILPHTNPDQIMRFVNGKGRLLAEIAPTQQPYGWPRRSGFIQPLVDAELLAGLDRFGCVNVLWSRTLESYETSARGVAATISAPDGSLSTISARYLVGCDGGRSTTRRLMGTSFEGTTSPTRWLVIDLRNDPVGSPNVYVGADPRRPFVSVSLAHGVRRFEFMMNDDEPDEIVDEAGFLAGLLKPHVPYPAQVDVIRKRVYTHHSRIAGEFRKGPVLIAGDAAHLMPVWQGQGYNSGIRDAANLGWKLAAVTGGRATDALLDTYELERRGHARAMIDLSTLVGRFISPRNRGVAALRDAVAVATSAVPGIKRHLVEMRFKPMPRYERGAVSYAHTGTDDAVVGRQFIQPRVDTRARRGILLDDVLGPWFSLLFWNNDPLAVLDKEAERWLALGARLITLRSASQLAWTGDDHPDVEIVADGTGELKRWFDANRPTVLFLRPDRFVAAACVAQHAQDVSHALADTLFIPGRS
ncbi:bifunctional 3-(3-hydroxy-phenyl)propionate/3-hydroxycinnamic acid hydroxylase [Actinomadura sp. LD22]|uniref:Bifunctional 3-(3-hydroxy-phenyl)propionate/3-hydroxycinnamic acid hydroxylase n=2 Tax=Actinomadura physcomitrii TaxID=2650748 RepID=A0A6I4MNR3_9ACTN|nr:bifunctional 3-(3-hydroxy-phenyl)propionate/3-hydroxycinnamic acid hydroxylase [Actinomadura physcomitrii]